MTDELLGNEAILRLGFFLGVFLIVAVWEAVSPRRRRDIPRLFRWSNNLGIVLLDTLAVRFTFPLLAVGMAILAEENSWGLLPCACRSRLRDPAQRDVPVQSWQHPHSRCSRREVALGARHA